MKNAFYNKFYFDLISGFDQWQFSVLSVFLCYDFFTKIIQEQEYCFFALT